ncbi:unnamed protein product, partial [Rangifer tarandus platyrhynchus]
LSSCVKSCPRERPFVAQGATEDAVEDTGQERKRGGRGFSPLRSSLTPEPAAGRSVLPSSSLVLSLLCGSPT